MPMNNRIETENIWNNIRRGSPHRNMHSFIRWKTVVWGLIVALIGFCIWQGMQWWRLKPETDDTIRSIHLDIDQQLKSLREEVKVKKDRLAFLEEQALSSQNKDLIAWVTEQTEIAKTQMIGVEHLKERQVEDYVYTPVKFTLRGDYHSFGRLINLFERSQYPVKVDYFSITTRKDISEGLILEIVLCEISTLENKKKVI